MANQLPLTTTRLSHALTIRAGPGRVVGAIHTWDHSQSRQIEEVWDMDANAVGYPADIIPQTLRTRTLKIGRYDLYTDTMEEVFGTRELITLTDQYRPFSLREIWRAPLRAPVFAEVQSAAIASLNNVRDTLVGKAERATSNALAMMGAAGGTRDGVASFAGRLLGDAFEDVITPRRVYEYMGCWFSDMGRRASSTGDRVVSVDATVIYKRRRRVF